jgi:hypothetical protein
VPHRIAARRKQRGTMQPSAVQLRCKVLLLLLLLLLLL